MFCWTVTKKRSGPAGVGHAAVAVGHKLYCFEVYCDMETYMDDTDQIEVNVFNTVSLSWGKSPPATPGSKRPQCLHKVHAVRKGHTAVLIEDVVYIWGGVKCHTFRHLDKPCNVLYAFDVETHRWFKPKVSGIVPEARRSHTACALGRVMYICGGYIKVGYTNCSDIHKLDTTTMAWSLINTRATGMFFSYPELDATIIGTKMFVVQLRGYKYVIVFDTETNRWLAKRSALPLSCHSAFAYKGELYIFGHKTSVGLSYLWKFNQGTCSWKRFEPKGKCGRSGMYCMVGDRIILFGGSYYNINNCLYILDLSPSLKTLCKRAVIQCGLKTSELPHNIRWELAEVGSHRGQQKRRSSKLWTRRKRRRDTL